LISGLLIGVDKSGLVLWCESEYKIFRKDLMDMRDLKFDNAESDKAAKKVQELRSQRASHLDESEETAPGAPVRPRIRAKNFNFVDNRPEATEQGRR